MTDTTPLTEGYLPEEWTYTGRRLTQDRILADSWLDPTGEPLLYKVGRGRTWIVGGTYRIPAKRDGQSVRASFGEADYLGQCEDEEGRRSWYAADVAANTAHRQAKLEARMAKDNPLGDALDTLAAAYAKVPYPEKAAMLAYLMTRITRGGW